jgi:hypothetical protein
MRVFSGQFDDFFRSLTRACRVHTRVNARLQIFPVAKDQNIHSILSRPAP